MRRVLYTGKGGVGKTTTAAATAAWAASRGTRTLVASTDLAHSLGDVLQCGSLGPEPRAIGPALHAVELDPRVEAERHWGRIHSYLVQLLRHQGIDELVADELALLPGAEEITTLLAVQSVAEAHAFDFVVIDCAPTGAALRLLTAPDILRTALRWLLRVQRGLSIATPALEVAVGLPLPRSAVFRDVEALLFERLRSLSDWIRAPETQIRLVTTPERLSVEEALRAHTDLALFELPCDAVVMNRVLPARAAEEPFFRETAHAQAQRIEDFGRSVAPLPVLSAPLAEDEVVGRETLVAHGRAIFGGGAPDRVLCEAVGLRFEATEGGARVLLPLPHAAPSELEIAKQEDRLWVRSAGRRRQVSLPHHLRALHLLRARWADGTLQVELGERAP